MNSGVYRAASDKAMLEGIRGSRLEVVRISLGEGKNLLDSIAAALSFPAWFGGNWDALEDCLTDLSWREGEGHVLVFEEFTPGDELGILIDVLGACAEFWALRGKPFIAVFIDPQRRLPLPALAPEG